MMGLKTPQLLFWNKPDLKGKSFFEDEPTYAGRSDEWDWGLETSEFFFGHFESGVHYAEFENLLLF